MKNAGKMIVLGTLGFLSAGLLLTGCKSAPELTQANAQAMIQAKYDQTPAVGAEVVVDVLGLGEGIAAKYWERTTLYPNRFWADFTLTPEGKKVVTLKAGGDVIKWRPESADDAHYSIIVVSVASNHLKARDVQDPQDELGSTKSAVYSEAVNLDGVPGPLQDIAHNPGNKLSGKKTATFAFDGGVWKLTNIQ